MSPEIASQDLLLHIIHTYLPLLFTELLSIHLKTLPLPPTTHLPSMAAGTPSREMSTTRNGATLSKGFVK